MDGSLVMVSTKILAGCTGVEFIPDSHTLCGYSSGVLRSSKGNLRGMTPQGLWQHIHSFKCLLQWNLEINWQATWAFLLFLCFVPRNSITMLVLHNTNLVNTSSFLCIFFLVCTFLGRNWTTIYLPCPLVSIDPLTFLAVCDELLVQVITKWPYISPTARWTWSKEQNIQHTF